MAIYKILDWDQILDWDVRSNLVIFGDPLTLVHFQTIERRHKNNRCTLLP